MERHQRPEEEAMAHPPCSYSFQPSPCNVVYGSPPVVTYDLDNQIMLSAILSLSLVVVVVISLHLYARYVLSRQPIGRVVVHSLGLATTGNAPSGEPPRTGLDPAVIASLPMFIYKQEEGDATSTECAVCLSMLEDQEMARILPNCNHTFHAECIDKWLSSRSTCPICRTEAEPRIQPEPREGPAGGGLVAPTLDHVNSTFVCIEGTSEVGGTIQLSPSPKVSSSVSRLSSFRRMLTRERSSRRIQCEIQGDHGFEDLERQ